MSRKRDLAECEAAMKHVIRKLEGLLRKEARIQPRDENVITALEEALGRAEHIEAICMRLR